MDNGIRKVVIYEQYGILAKTTILTVFKRQKKLWENAWVTEPIDLVLIFANQFSQI